MNETEVQNVLSATLTRIAPEVQVEELDANTPLRDQVDLDSMDWLNFLIGLHERLHVDIPEADYAKLITLNDLKNYLAARVQR